MIAIGKGRMVTLLAPVYLADRFVGAIGTDVTLTQLADALRSHPVKVSRALVVNELGTVLADSGGALQGVQGKVLFTQLFPGASSPPAEGNPEWQRLPLAGTSWTLLVNTPTSALTLLLQDLLAALLLAALLGLVLMQQRRRADAGSAHIVLEQARGELVRADQLGMLGGMLASVSREIDQPLRQAVQRAGDALPPQNTLYAP